MTGLYPPAEPVTGARARGCYTCTYNRGRRSVVHVICEREPNFPRVVGIAKDGCAFWQREPGADDE